MNCKIGSLLQYIRVRIIIDIISVLTCQISVRSFGIIQACVSVSRRWLIVPRGTFLTMSCIYQTVSMPLSCANEGGCNDNSRYLFLQLLYYIPTVANQIEDFMCVVHNIAGNISVFQQVVYDCRFPAIIDLISLTNVANS